MLSLKELDVLKRASRKSATGAALRRHWLPVLPETGLPEPDAEPITLKVLTESLVLFRDTSGRIGVIDAYCPHEAGIMAWGRNAENGLMCPLHGWKFDVDGNRVDGGAFGGGRTTAYPAVVHQGLVWIYMGGRDAIPPPPAWQRNARERGTHPRSATELVSGG